MATATKKSTGTPIAGKNALQPLIEKWGYEPASTKSVFVKDMGGADWRQVGLGPMGTTIRDHDGHSGETAVHVLDYRNATLEQFIKLADPTEKWIRPKD